MNYKKGQKVIIRDDINTRGWDHDFAQKYKELNKIVTIIEVGDYWYQFEEINGEWIETYIKELYVIPIPIDSRFEILDL